MDSMWIWKSSFLVYLFPAPVFNTVETYSVTIDNIPIYSSVLAQSWKQQQGRILGNFFYNTQHADRAKCNHKSPQGGAV